MKRAQRLTQCLIKPLLQHLTQGLTPAPAHATVSRART
jgi:hypothetical protein